MLGDVVGPYRGHKAGRIGLRGSHGGGDLRGRALALGAGTEARFDGLTVAQDGDATQHQGFQREEHRKPPAVVVGTDICGPRAAAGPVVGVTSFSAYLTRLVQKKGVATLFYTPWPIFRLRGAIILERMTDRGETNSAPITQETFAGAKGSREKWEKGQKFNPIEHSGHSHPGLEDSPGVLFQSPSGLRVLEPWGRRE